MTSDAIRKLFLDYYGSKGHTPVPSGSLVPSSYDPSVLLTTAGMQPFKPYFLGMDTPPAPRLTSCQKCFRTPDIDQVGLTARHLTFFEMLGNFSFGDYFKQGAIEMAWSLVTDGLNIDSDRLWATVHAGDQALGLGLDEEAVELWKSQGLPGERIVPLGADNFWKAGPTGPCGPCSEIYYDRGAEYGCSDPQCKPGCECDRYLEFYNLVFMQYDRDDQGVLTPLPNQNIDTGMGLERLASLLQGNVSVFEIDTMRGIIDWAAGRAGIKGAGTDAEVRALRILCDHGRGMTFLTADGVAPSNEGRGYVLRRIIRRAIQQADRIGMYNDAQGGVLEQLADEVIGRFGDHYTDLREHRSEIVQALSAEEERFLRTLRDGSARLQEALTRVTSTGATNFPGDVAFQLHDTFGFPVDLTAELAAEAGLDIDRSEFETLMQQQRERARAAAGGGSLPTEQAAALARAHEKTSFVGYDSLEVATTITAIEPVADDTGRVLIKLASSPLYAAGGGQVSDLGWINGPGGRATVESVMRFEDDQVVVATIDGSLQAGDEVTVSVDTAAREATQSNHTATHLLHAALRSVLGDHVRQAGSLVAPDRLRFDFSHGAALTDDELERVASIVNSHIASGERVAWSEMSIDDAREAGAMMLFGEKYGERVRMVDVGDGQSRELCGGTHVSNTAQIRQFLITHEGSVGADTRRIEALTADGAARFQQVRVRAADAAAAAAGVAVEQLPDRVHELVSEHRRLEREIARLRSGSALDDALECVEDLGPVRMVVFRNDNLEGDELLELSDRIKSKLDPAAVLLGSAADGKVSLIANVSDGAVKVGIRAGDVVKAAAAVVGGGGGGRPTMARAGGKDPSKLDEALARGGDAIRSALA